MADQDQSGAQSADPDTHQRPKVCFVVMPFGKKSRGPDKPPHDFDKLYRVVIKRAVERAGMICLRADETKGSRIIHTDMFRDLRDQPLVIADLSMHNPNVFYELGVRHTMSSTGTVLMCEQSSFPLPFDIGLSRVVPYTYDGVSLDWEEAERLVEQLHVQLLESGPTTPDSPVHALLERVLSKQDDDDQSQSRTTSIGRSADIKDLERYIDLIVEKWRGDKTDLGALFQDYRGDLVGCSALGEYVLSQKELPTDWASKIADQLSDLANFDLSAQIYERMHAEGVTDHRDLIRYASAYSELHPRLGGADRALEIMAEAIAKQEEQFASDPDTADAVAARAYCLQKQAGLIQWKWELSQNGGDLEKAIQAQSDVIDVLVRARSLGGTQAREFSSLLAQTHLKRLLLLRNLAGGEVLEDPKNDIKGVLDIQELADDKPTATSYLRWYRAIALADSGAEKAVRQTALDAFAKDADLMQNKDENPEIGNRQYSQLRRFLSNYATWFRNSHLIGFVGQTLQSRR